MTIPSRAPSLVPTPQPQGQPVNIKIELTISEESGSAALPKKIVSMTVGDREFGRIRSSAMMQPSPTSTHEVPLHVDARPIITLDGRIRVNMTINYDSMGGARDAASYPSRIQLREELGVILESGKPLVVSQSADPLGDRKVMVEVKATILR